MPHDLGYRCAVQQRRDRRSRATFDTLLGTPQGRLDAKEMIDAMIKIVPSETGKFRNVVPQFIEDMLREHQLNAWEVTI